MYRRYFLVALFTLYIGIGQASARQKVQKDPRTRTKPVSASIQGNRQAFQSRLGGLSQAHSTIVDTLILRRKSSSGPMRRQGIPAGKTSLSLGSAPNGSTLLPALDAPGWITGNLGRIQTSGHKAGDGAEIRAALDIIAGHSETFRMVDAVNELQPIGTQRDDLGYTHFRFEQMYRGIPLWGRDMYLHVDDNGKVYAMNGDIEPTPDQLSVLPGLTAGAAEEFMIDDLKMRERWAPATGPGAELLGLNEVENRLVIYPDENNGPTLAWEINLHPNFSEWVSYLVDAETGEVLTRIQLECTSSPKASDGPASPVFLEFETPKSQALSGRFVDAEGVDLNGVTQHFRVFQNDEGGYQMVSDLDNLDMANFDLPMWDKGGAGTFLFQEGGGSQDNGVVVESETNTWTDASAISAHVNQRIAYNYFKHVHGRNALDDRNQSLISFVHLTENGQSVENAGWNGRYLYYGDGGPDTYPWAAGLDIAGHELTHGVISNTAGLIYEFQSGALNESFADVFAVLIDRDDFLWGEDLVREESSIAIRDLEHPDNPDLALRQPAHMQYFAHLNVREDNGGVHINSGIPNRAAVLIIKAVGREIAEQVYYRAVTKYLTRYSQFIDARRALEQSAVDLYGENGFVHHAVQDAFDAVGIDKPYTTSYNPGNDIPVQTGGASVIALVMEDGTIALLDMTAPDQPVVSVFEGTDSPQTKVRVDPDIGDYAQLSVDRAGTTIWFVNQVGQLTTLDISSGVVASFDDIWIEEPGDLWNAAIDPSGSIAALVSTYNNDATLYFFTGGPPTAMALKPESVDGETRRSSIVYPDAISWSPNSRDKRLAFDALNKLPIDSEEDYYWSIYEVDFQNERIYDFLPPEPSTVSIGNLTYSNGDPDLFAFNRIDHDTERVDVVFGEGNLGNLTPLMTEDGQSVNALRPSFSPDDQRLAMFSINSNDLIITNGTDFATLDLSLFTDRKAVNPLWFVVNGSGGPGNQHPTAKMQSDATEGTVPFTVFFEGRVSSDPEDGNDLGFYWDFGDGMNGGGPFIEHTFNVPGTFEVSLTVLDSGSLFDIETRTITVHPANDTATEEESLPDDFSLTTVYPNPFHTSTKIGFNLPASGHVRIDLFDVLGREVTVLEDDFLAAGSHEVTLSGSDLPPGMYIVRLTGAGNSMTRTLVKIR